MRWFDKSLWKTNFVLFLCTSYLVWPTAQPNSLVLDFTSFPNSILYNKLHKCIIYSMLKIIIELQAAHLSHHSNAKSCTLHTHTCLCCCWHKVYASMHTSKTHYGVNFTCSCLYAKRVCQSCCVACFVLVLVVTIVAYTKTKKFVQCFFCIYLYRVKSDSEMDPSINFATSYSSAVWVNVNVASKIQLSYRNHDRISEFILIGFNTFEFFFDELLLV